MRRNRRVKIVATLGPASNNEEKIGALFKAGADVFRINMSHATPEGVRDTHAIIRKLEVIGEAVKQLSDETRRREPAIPWRQIAGMRDHLSHAYFGIDLALVWRVIERDLQPLDAAVAGRFFAALAASTPAAIACEPRHPSWFAPPADGLLAAHAVARVAADPAICEAARHPGGAAELAYWRLHGSPRMYRSSYADRLPDYARLVAQAAPEREVWCIFDNTASSAAARDALELSDLLSPKA